MVRALPWLSLSLLAACAGSADPREVREVSLTVTSPEYGAYLGDGPIEVVGTVSDGAATVLVEDVVVPVSGDGTFRTTLELVGDYEVIDIKAGGDDLIGARERIPVFAGNPSIDTFTNAMPGRMTNDGLSRLGASLGAQIDESGWAEGLLRALPPLDTAAVKLTPRSVTHDPTQVVITGVEGGLRIGIELRNVVITTDASWSLGPITGSAPLGIGYDTITITLLATPEIRPDGVVVLTVNDSEIDFVDPRFTLDGNPLVGLSFLVDAANQLLEPAGEWLVDQVLGVAGEIELGGPFEFETEFGESTLAIALHDVDGDPEGLPFRLGVGIDEPVPEVLSPVEYPSASTRADGEVHLVVGVHEYLIEGLVAGQIDGVLGGDLDISQFSSVLGLLLNDVPGNNFAPEGEWCLALDVGPARAVRLKDGIAPMGSLYLPDVTLDLGKDAGNGCESWLVTNLAMEIDLVPEGTEISIEIGMGEGAVLSYGAPREAWTEREVVAEVANLVDAIAAVAGGQLSIDLAELTAGVGGEEGLGSALGEIEPRILDSQPMTAEGMVAISIGVWPTP